MSAWTMVEMFAALRKTAGLSLYPCLVLSGLLRPMRVRVRDRDEPGRAQNHRLLSS